MAGLVVSAEHRTAEITYEMVDLLTLRDLREFMTRVEKMPNDAQIRIIPDSHDCAGGVKAIWQTRNPL